MNAIPISTGELANRLDCRLEGRADLMVVGIATIEEAGPDQLTFMANPRYRQYIASSKAGVIIIAGSEDTPPEMIRIISEHPYQAFQQALGILYPPQEPDVAEGIDPTAAVDPSVEIGADVRIGPFVEIKSGARIGARTIICSGSYIGGDVLIGEDCTIGIGAVIRRDITIGDRVVIGDRTVIGFDGFGYAPSETGFHKIPQVGTVEIGDDVEIGANCCIDRAAVGTTTIGRGSKLDNLIQIAHGVQIGEHTVIAAQTGISGSTKIGSWVVMGGQVATVGHIEIGDRMIVGGRTGVTKSFDIKGMISGYPARPHTKAMRIEASLNRLPDLLKRVKVLEKRLEKKG